MLESEGSREAAINVAEGRKRAQILASEGEKAEQINKAAGRLVFKSVFLCSKEQMLLFCQSCFSALKYLKSLDSIHRCVINSSVSCR